MSFRRKPPLDNVRRVQTFSGNLNLRGVTTNKAGRSVQMESQQESALCLLLDRDPNVKDYVSQFNRFHYRDEEGREHTYIPDFFAWTCVGQDQVHEVTITSRDTQRRDNAGRELCEENNWQFIRHDETTLPQGTELANLIFLFGYRPSGYRNDGIINAIKEILDRRRSVRFDGLITELNGSLSDPQNMIVPTIYHLLWHGDVFFDMTKSLLSDSDDRQEIVLYQVESQ